MFRGIGFRCASGALLLASVAGLILAACNSSNPVAPAPPPPTGSSTFTVTLAASPSSLATGSTTPATITVSVRRTDNGQPPPNGTNVSVNTSLGSLGTDSSGNPVTITTLALAGGSAQVNLFAGTATGTAQVLAQVEQSIGQVAVPIQTVNPPPFFLISVAPNFGNAVGGQQVTITGSGIQAPVRVTFGDAVARLGTVTATTIQATVPRSTQPLDVGQTRTVDVEVTNALGQSNSTSDKLVGSWTYSGGDIEPPIAVFSASPSSGPNEGNTTVTINGTGFQPPVQVLFGLTIGGGFQGLQATVNPGATATQISVKTPSANGVGLSLANQLVNVQVRNVNTGQSAIGTGLFSYTGSGLFVTSMSPLSGPYTGGTLVTIQGSGFSSSGQFQVNFGGSVQLLQPGHTQTQLQVKTVPVTVTNCQPPSGTLTVTRLDTGEVANSAIRFSYTAPSPNITGLSPTSGSQSGGTVVSIGGTGFDTQVRATFGGAVATVGNVSSTSVSATTPAFTGTFDTEPCTDSHGMQGKRNKPKLVDVAVTNTSTGCADTFPMSYTYQPSDTSCVVPPPVKPTADFTFQTFGANVLFSDASTNSPTGYLWDFGEPSSGGSNVSTVANPSHLYASVPPNQTRTFTVSLTASNAGGSNTAVKQITVTAPPP
ncbi:MAG TPA: IPT/TIG domain-containing protein [Thermoanaerobaculia bacterium]|nr:IPT/TIG domain-containing protein [Thermoanaerobaculia bacterium]